MHDDADDDPVEGCPDCGADAVTDTPEGGTECTACGWRS